MRVGSRNFTREAKRWIMNVSGLGPGIGHLFYMAVADSAYETELLESGVPANDIAHTLEAGEDMLTASRNDCLLALPGTYVDTAVVTWDKSSTHLFALGSDNQRIPATAGTTGNVFFTNVTTGITTLLDITGHHCMFHGFSTYLSCAAGIADVTVKGRNIKLSKMFMKSGQHATQFASAALGYALSVDASVAGYAHALRVEDCQIGDCRNSSSGDGATPKTAGGVILMAGTTNAGSCIEFRRNFISQWSHTNACSAVFHNSGLDRYTLWEDCYFYNFYTNLASVLTGGVFTDSCGTTHMHLMTGKTAQYGWTNWTNNDAYMFGAMPIPDVAGGEMLTLSG